eukprot:686699-Rhodomonas_salina.3
MSGKAGHPAYFDPQSEKAYMKQPTVFKNKKSLIKKGTLAPRKYVACDVRDLHAVREKAPGVGECQQRCGGSSIVAECMRRCKAASVLGFGTRSSNKGWTGGAVLPELCRTSSHGSFVLFSVAGIQTMRLESVHEQSWRAQRDLGLTCCHSVRTIVIRRDYLHYIKKYNRYEKRHKNVSAHCSPAFKLNEGDSVVIGQCRSTPYPLPLCAQKQQNHSSKHEEPVNHGGSFAELGSDQTPRLR